MRSMRVLRNSVEFYVGILPFVIFNLYNVSYILNIVYYHVYNHSKQLELSVQFMFSRNRDSVHHVEVNFREKILQHCLTGLMVQV